MKINKSILIIGIIVLFMAGYAFKPTTKSYTYLTIQSYRPDFEDVYICIGGKEYTNLHLQKQVQGILDLNPVLNLISQYENDGWEMQQFDKPGNLTFILMRKEK